MLFSQRNLRLKMRSYFAFLPVTWCSDTHKVTKWLGRVYVCVKPHAIYPASVERFYTRAAYEHCLQINKTMPGVPWHWNRRLEVELDSEPSVSVHPDWVEHYPHITERGN